MEDGFDAEGTGSEEVLSLDELTRAFAEAMERTDRSLDATDDPDAPHGTDSVAPDRGTPHDDEDEDEDAAPRADSQDVATVEAAAARDDREWSLDGFMAVEVDAEADDACAVTPATILEAMLFMDNQNNEPTTAVRAASVMRGVAPEEIPDIVAQLNHRYAADRCPYHIVHEGAGYRMVLRDEFEPVRASFYGRVRETKLSQAAIDVLAIVAYRQPVTEKQVSQLRDASSRSVLSQLVRRQLVRIDAAHGGADEPRYSTTDRFLEMMKIRDLDDLPRTEEAEDDMPGFAPRF